MLTAVVTGNLPDNVNILPASGTLALENGLSVTFVSGVESTDDPAKVLSSLKILLLTSLILVQEAYFIEIRA